VVVVSEVEVARVLVRTVAVVSGSIVKNMIKRVMMEGRLRRSREDRGGDV